MESKFEKMDDQDDIHTAYEKLYKLSEKHEKLYRLATKKFSDVKLDREELFTKFDEANQTIGTLKFENNFLTEKTKKFEAELFQVRAQLEGTSSAKLDKMLNIRKSASDQTGLGYNFSSSSIAFASTTVFVPLAKKAKKKEAKNPRVKKANSQKSKKKKQQLCHHCGVAGHTRPNCYKWLATQ